MGIAAVGERLVDGAIAALHSTRERAVVGEHLYLSGLFAPVLEEHTAADIKASEGAIPAGLDGMCVLCASVARNPRLTPGAATLASGPTRGGHLQGSTTCSTATALCVPAPRHFTALCSGSVAVPRRRARQRTRRRRVAVAALGSAVPVS